MKTRLLRIILIAAAFPSLANACTCSNVTPGRCPGLQPTDVVFTGTVTAAEVLPPEKPAADQGVSSDPAPTTADAVGLAPGQTSSGQTGAGQTSAGQDAAAPTTTVAAPIIRYHFHIDERFAGPDQAEIDIFSGGDDGDCGYKFQKGAQYIVFTRQETDGRLFSTICDGTRPVSDGIALLPQLRAMRDGRRVASVFGVLRRADPPFLSPPDDPDDPISDISLKLRSNIDRFETSSNRTGVYSFYDVHAGTYNFTANLPPGTELTQKMQSSQLSAFEIPEGACYEYDVYALPTGHIGGTVLGADGKPLGIASLELFRVGSYSATRPGYWGFQGATGVFDFDHVGPGKYILVYNRANRMDPNSPYPRAFYPGVTSVDKAKPITLKDGQSLQKITMKVAHGYPARTLRVRVKWTGVQPAGDVVVAVKADKWENPSVNRVSDGLYVFTLFKDANYTISAWENLAPQRVAPKRKAACILPVSIQAGSVSVSGANANTKEVTLTFPKPVCGKQ